MHRREAASASGIGPDDETEVHAVRLAVFPHRDKGIKFVR